MYTDVLARDHTQLANIDVYICGFLCQSLSDINLTAPTPVPKMGYRVRMQVDTTTVIQNRTCAIALTLDFISSRQQSCGENCEYNVQRFGPLLHGPTKMIFISSISFINNVDNHTRNTFRDMGDKDDCIVLEDTCDGSYSKCCVCMDNLANYVIVNCGHMCACETCLQTIQTSARPKCPICSREFKATQRVYVSGQPQREKNDQQRFDALVDDQRKNAISHKRQCDRLKRDTELVQPTLDKAQRHSLQLQRQLLEHQQRKADPRSHVTQLQRQLNEAKQHLANHRTVNAHQHLEKTQQVFKVYEAVRCALTREEEAMSCSLEEKSNAVTGAIALVAHLEQHIEKTRSQRKLDQDRLASSKENVIKAKAEEHAALGRLDAAKLAVLPAAADELRALRYLEDAKGEVIAAEVAEDTIAVDNAKLSPPLLLPLSLPLNKKKKEEEKKRLAAWRGLDMPELHLREDWICPSCTFANDSDRDICEVCDLERPDEEPMVGQAAEQIEKEVEGRRRGNATEFDRTVNRLRRGRGNAVCPRCTLENTLCASTCNACCYKFIKDDGAAAKTEFARTVNSTGP